MLFHVNLDQEIDEKEEKISMKAATEEKELAEIDKPPKTAEFWFVAHCTDI